MIAQPPGVVFDCNIFFQAMISSSGPSAACLQKVRDAEIRLYISDYILSEIRDLPADPQLRLRFRIDEEKVERFITSFLGFTHYTKVVPEVYIHPHDPDDSHYVNLALANNANLIVSRDRDLLNLTDFKQPEAREFQQRFPRLRILDPVALLRELAKS